MVDISAGIRLKHTDASKQKEKGDIKTRKSEKQALQPTLDMMVDKSTNYALNKQEEQVRIRNLIE